ncbi:MAG: T9SS type A sorting domain-containing protein [Bacteroidales bacterium]|nr:T9SS type A sorting domain-containing protein [Bacteroidales bacterium]
MKTVVLSFMFLVFWNFSFSQSLSPTLISSAGAYAEGNGISLSYSLGEIAVTTLTTDNLVLTQGFHQPQLTGTGIPDKVELDWKVNAFPNPVQDQLNISIRLEKPVELNLAIFDLTGKKLLIKKLGQIPADFDHSIDFSGFANGIYFLRIQTSDKKYNRIIKIQKQ